MDMEVPSSLDYMEYKILLLAHKRQSIQPEDITETTSVQSELLHALQELNRKTQTNLGSLIWEMLDTKTDHWEQGIHQLFQQHKRSNCS